MTTRDSHGRPIIVAAEWFGKLPAQPRKLKPGEQPTIDNSASAATDEVPSSTATVAGVDHEPGFGASLARSVQRGH